MGIRRVPRLMATCVGPTGLELRSGQTDVGVTAVRQAPCLSKSPERGLELTSELEHSSLFLRFGPEEFKRCDF